MKSIIFITIFLTSSSVFASSTEKKQPLKSAASKKHSSEKILEIADIIKAVDLFADDKKIEKIVGLLNSSLRKQSSILQTAEVEAVGRKSDQFDAIAYEVTLEQPLRISSLGATRSLRSRNKKIVSLEATEAISSLKVSAITTYLRICESNDRIKVLSRIQEILKPISASLSQATSRGSATRVTAMKTSLFTENLANQQTNLEANNVNLKSILSQLVHSKKGFTQLSCNDPVPEKALELENSVEYQLEQSRLGNEKDLAKLANGYEFSVQLGYEQGYEDGDKNFLFGLSLPLGQDSAAKSEYYEKLASKMQKEISFSTTKNKLITDIFNAKNKKRSIQARLGWLNNKIGTSKEISRKAVNAFRSGSIDFQNFMDSVEIDLETHIEFIESKFNLEKTNLEIWALGGFSK